MATKSREPTWWSSSPPTPWDRLKEAVRRDWEQTKHDLHLRGGHELNQTIGHTWKQVTGIEPIPANERPNPSKIIGELHDKDEPIAFGERAFAHYGALYPTWSLELEGLLSRDWDRSAAGMVRNWREVRHCVRDGYERVAGTTSH
jgi:hypothetical protein